MEDKDTPQPAASVSLRARIKSTAMKPSVIVMAIASGAAWGWLQMTPADQASVLALSPTLLKLSPLITLVCGVIARELPAGYFLKLFGLKSGDDE